MERANERLAERHNLLYFLVGRHTGFAAYYFPGFVALVLFLVFRRQQTAWGWLTLAGGVGSAIALMLYMPFTYSGGGGPVGNRYFLGSPTTGRLAGCR